MAWYLIISGIILIGYSLFEKIRGYLGKKENLFTAAMYKKNKKVAHNQRDHKQNDLLQLNQGQLKQLNNKIDQMLTAITDNKNEIIKQIGQLENKDGNNIVASNDEVENEDNFEKILQKKYHQEKKETAMGLPDNYKNVLALAEER